MLTRIRKATEDKDSGFTLIELLVVMIIIGILAAIAIPVFMNQRQRAVDAGIKSDLRNIASEVESIYTDNQVYPVAGAGGVVTTTNAVTVAGTPVRTSRDNVFVYTVSGESFCITGSNPRASKNGSSAALRWYYSSANGGLQPSTTAAC